MLESENASQAAVDAVGVKVENPSEQPSLPNAIVSFRRTRSSSKQFLAVAFIRANKSTREVRLPRSREPGPRNVIPPFAQQANDVVGIYFRRYS